MLITCCDQKSEWSEMNWPNDLLHDAFKESNLKDCMTSIGMQIDLYKSVIL